MDTQDLIIIKKQRIQEDLYKLVPPGFHLSPPPKNRGTTYENLDRFLDRDTEFLMQVGYLYATNKDYDTAIQHLRFFGYSLSNYKEAEGKGIFHKEPELNRNLVEACDYLIRFYDLAEITIKRINDEEDVRLKLLQQQQDKEKKTLEQSEEKKQKAKSFVSGATSFRPGTKAKLKVTKLPGIIPKRAAPQEIVDKISKPQLEAQETEEGIGGSKRIVSALGRLALSIEQTNDNLNATLAKIAEDIANTKVENKKEVDEYRKRVANSGRKIGKTELGSSKVDVSGLVKKYVGNFFSGAGGAIRALALFNMLEAFMNGRPLDALGPLLGIGATYLPAIGGLIAGMIGKKVLGGLLGAARGGSVARGGVTAARGVGTAAAGMPRLGKFGAIAALGAGALALGSGMLGKNGGEQDTSAPDSAIQTRLDELETQQKESTQPQALGAIPDSALKRFEALNQKFENALDFLLKKQKEVPQQRSSGRGSGGGGGRGNPRPSLSLIPGNAPTEMKSLMDLISEKESSGNYEAMYPSTTLPGATDMTISDVARRATGPVGRYQQKPEYLVERARAVGLNPDTDKFTPENQDKITRGHIVNLLGGDESKVVEELKKDPSAVKRRLEQSQFTGLQKFSDEDFKKFFEERNKIYGPQSSVRPITPPSKDVAKVVQSTPNLIALGLPPQKSEKTPMSMGDNGGNPINPVSTGYDCVYSDSAKTYCQLA